MTEATTPDKEAGTRRKPKPKRARPITKPIRQGPEGTLTLPENTGAITYYPHFLTASESTQLYTETLHARSWARSPIAIPGGTQVLQPRDTALFGTALYSYSLDRTKPTGWQEDLPASAALQVLAGRLEDALMLQKGWFNVVLANRYMHGGDNMGWHSDNERSLGDEPVIASVSVGAARRFVVRRIDDKSDKIEYVVGHGSLIVMTGRMQSFYQHCVPKVSQKTCSQTRLNFTFRRVVDESDQSKNNLVQLSSQDRGLCPEREA